MTPLRAQRGTLTVSRAAGGGRMSGSGVAVTPVPPSTQAGSHAAIQMTVASRTDTPRMAAPLHARDHVGAVLVAPHRMKTKLLAKREYIAEYTHCKHTVDAVLRRRALLACAAAVVIGRAGMTVCDPDQDAEARSAASHSIERGRGTLCLIQRTLH